MEAIKLTDNQIPHRSDPPAAEAPLWDKLRAGSSEAFEQIFRLYYPSLLNYGLRFN